MDGLEDKLSSILGNPEMMQKIMTMAQSMNAAPSNEKETSVKEPQLNGFDPSMLQKLSGLNRQGNIDKHQQNLLHALRPYLNKERIRRLENAMRAAKMARFVATAMNQQGSIPQSFR